MKELATQIETPPFIPTPFLHLQRKGYVSGDGSYVCGRAVNGDTNPTSIIYDPQRRPDIAIYRKRRSFLAATIHILWSAVSKPRAICVAFKAAIIWVQTYDLVVEEKNSAALRLVLKRENLFKMGLKESLMKAELFNTCGYHIESVLIANDTVRRAKWYRENTAPVRNYIALHALLTSHHAWMACNESSKAFATPIRDIRIAIGKLKEVPTRLRQEFPIPFDKNGNVTLPC